MAGLKRRIENIEARLAQGGPQAPRTFAGFVKWETERRAANNGTLTPAESEWIGAAFRDFMTQAPGRRV